MKLPDWNAAEWVLVLTLVGFGCILVGMLAGSIVFRLAALALAGSPKG